MLTQAQVDTAWVRRYNGPADSSDCAQALAVDNRGNVYVTGCSFGVGIGEDYATAKYSASGAPRWVARYNGPVGSYDAASAIAVDSAGNVYVTGRSYGVGTRYDFATIKYDSLGAEKWVARYNGPGNYHDEARAITLDRMGNVYVTGWSYDATTLDDYTTIKYDSLGAEKWVARYNGPGGDNDEARDIAIDDAGNLYVTGWSMGSGTDADYATVKYTPAGVRRWAVRYNGPENSTDEAYALAVDRESNIYVTGVSYRTSTYYDYVTVKYDSSGSEKWVARYDGPSSSPDYAYDAAVDDSGNVYVTGRSFDTNGSDYDYATVKYDSLGGEQWAVRYNGPGNSDDEAYAIAVDNAADVFITGRSVGPSGDIDYATVKYNTFGVQQWVRRYNGPGNSDDGAYALAVDTLGNVYVTGGSFGSGTFEDYATIKYIQGTSGLEENAEGSGQKLEVRLTATPNPFTSFARVPGHSSGRFALYDVSGRKVGVYKGDRIGSGLSIGIYFLKPEGQDTKPLRVVKLR